MSSSCKTCDGNVTSLVSLHANNTQKSILRQNRVGQSLYIQNVASLNNTINPANEGKKYDSYQRYLLKKKGKLFQQQGKKIASVPNYGNKTQSMTLTSKNNSYCDFSPSG